MNDALVQVVPTRKTGAEGFHAAGQALGFDVLSFWQWSASDLRSNATRGRLAEYLVARALGLAADGVRDEWAPYDLQTASGVKVEVKSAAYLQSWHQKALSPIKFVVPKTRAWNPETNELGPDAKRQADVYVFALLAHTDKATVDPLNVDQWKFWVLPTAVLDARARSQHSITLRPLEALAGAPVKYKRLKEVVDSRAGMSAL